MSKSDLIGQVAKVVGTKQDAQAAVDAVFSSITQALKSSDAVTITAFGSFKVVARPARKGRNPQTGAEMVIKAANVPRFVPGKALKETVN